MIEAGYDKTPEMMSDHPQAVEPRGEYRQAPGEVARRCRPVAQTADCGAQQFAAIQSRSAQLAQSLPNDKNMQQAQTLLASFPSCVAPADQPAQKQARKKVNEDAHKYN